MAIRTFADGSSLDTSTGVVTHNAPVEVKQPPTTQVSGGTSSSKPEVFDREGLMGNIKDTYKNYKGDAIANKAFLEGAYKASGQQYNRKQIENLGLEYVGSQDQLSKIVSKSKKEGNLPESNIVRLGKDVYTFGGRQPNLRQSMDFFNLSKELPDFGVDKVEEDKGTNGGATNNGTASVTTEDKWKPKTGKEYMNEITGITDAKAEEVGLSDKQTAVLEVEKEIKDMENSKDLSRILGIASKNERYDDFEDASDAIGDRIVPMSMINRQLNKLTTDFNKTESRISRDRILKDANDIYAYNAKINQYNMVRGKADLAEKAVKESADAYKEYRKMAIEDMAIQTNMDAIEKNELLQQNDHMWEREKLGYSLIEPKNYEAILNDPDRTRKISTDAYGNSYLAPEETNDSLTYKEELSNVKSELEIEKLLKEITTIGVDKLDFKDKMDAEMKIGNHFDSIAKENQASVKNIGIIETGYNELLKAVENGDSLNAPSQAMLVTFQKMLDPTSVVRESEYARSADGSSFLNRIKGAYDKLVQGGAGVTPEDLKTFYTVSKELQKGYQRNLLDMAKRSRIQAENYGLNLNNILTPGVLGMLEGADYETPEDVIGGVISTDDDWDW